MYKIFFLISIIGLLLMNNQVFASTQETQKAHEVINRFNAIKSYKYRMKIYNNDQLVGHAEASYLFPNLFRSKRTILINKEEVESITIVNGKRKWIYCPSRQTLEEYSITDKGGRKYQAIDNYVDSPSKIEYLGIRTIDNRETHLIRAVKEKNRNEVKYYDLYFDVQDGVLREIEAYAESEQNEIQVIEVDKVSKMVLESPPIRLKQVFYDYQLNVKIHPKEFQFVKPKNSELSVHKLGDKEAK